VDSVDPLDPALLAAPEPPLPADELLLWCFFLPWVALPDPVVPELLELPLPAVSELVEPDPVVPPLVDPPDCAKAAPAASIEITATRFHHVLCMPNCSIHGGRSSSSRWTNLVSRAEFRNGSEPRRAAPGTRTRAIARAARSSGHRALLARSRGGGPGEL